MSDSSLCSHEGLTKIKCSDCVNKELRHDLKAEREENKRLREGQAISIKFAEYIRDIAIAAKQNDDLHPNDILRDAEETIKALTDKAGS